jgi:hypothetical protein
MESITRFITQKLKLKVNEAKCKRRSNYPSLKRPGIPVAPE